MTREATERHLARRAAQAMRMAAIHLAREQAEADSAPSPAYGCVDWYRYDVTPLPPQAVAPAPSPVTARSGDERDRASATH